MARLWAFPGCECLLIGTGALGRDRARYLREHAEVSKEATTLNPESTRSALRVPVERRRDGAPQLLEERRRVLGAAHPAHRAHRCAPIIVGQSSDHCALCEAIPASAVSVSIDSSYVPRLAALLQRAR